MGFSAAPPQGSSERPTEPAAGARAEPEVGARGATGESCPEGMAFVPGGAFWVGTENETYDREENPRFKTRLGDFCAAKTEVTASQYEACVERGRCTPSHAGTKTCNTSAKGRGDHPINCVDHDQARTYCESVGARLPTEVEWEYLARGGAEMRAYPWGDAPVDGRACWKSHQSCAVASFPAGAFGLYDVVGNVWEWTDSWFGPYPFPQKDGRHKVYRGGSWSRRFDKWMRASLRNRLAPDKYGSHLGLRCVADAPLRTCPYGRDEASGRCRFGTDEVQCLGKETWNGVRCAPPGDAARCAAGTEEVPGLGCVRKPVLGAPSAGLDTAAVQRARSPEFDADCRKNAPSQPHAYKLTGGGHLARNAVGKSLGCRNRDVGVGWNSACCP